MSIHTFAICAYKDSPYLEACVRSLMAQTVKTNIIMCTSTPSQYISSICKRYEIPLYAHNENSNIQNDWNFAYSHAESTLVTIAHQDDMYHKDYVKELLKAYNHYPDMTLFTTSSVTVKGSKLIRFGKVEVIKKILRLFLICPRINHLTAVKKSAIAFGNPIICPACTYNRKLLGETLFNSNLSYALDWDILLNLAVRPGRFICIEKPLIYYRVHDNATSKKCIENHLRTKEEIIMYRKFWPGLIVDILMMFYKKAYEAYN